MTESDFQRIAKTNFSTKPSTCRTLLLTLLVVSVFFTGTGCNRSTDVAAASADAEIEPTASVNDDSPDVRYWIALNQAKALGNKTDSISLANAPGSISVIDLSGVDATLTEHGQSTADLLKRVSEYQGISSPFPVIPEGTYDFSKLDQLNDAILRAYQLENAHYFSQFAHDIKKLNADAEAIRRSIAERTGKDPGPPVTIGFDYRKHSACPSAKRQY